MTTPTILITGATGFIGGATLVRVLQSHYSCRLLLLVRADTVGAAASRLRDRLRRFTDIAGLETTLNRCEVLCGDLTDSATLADPRLDEVTHVLHLASNTSFRSVRGVRQTNILGALTLAHRMRRAPRLERFVYVGTGYICGDSPPRLVREDDYPRFGLRHIVEYTASKAECEMLLENTAPELPLVIARPSVVVGHTQLGCLPSASLFWFYRTIDLLRRTNFSMDMLEDVVPVDYTAEALLFLLLKPTLRYRRYHISAGEASCVSWHEIAAAFAECYGARPENPYSRVEFQTIIAERFRMRELLGPGDEDRLLMALELYFLFSKMGSVLFDNQRLLEEGMPPPPRFTSYLRQCAMLPPDQTVYQQMLDDD